MYCEDSCAWGEYSYGNSGENSDLHKFIVISSNIRGCGYNLIGERINELPEFLKNNADVADWYENKCYYSDFCNSDGGSGAGSLTTTAALILSAITAAILY